MVEKVEAQDINGKISAVLRGAYDVHSLQNQCRQAGIFPSQLSDLFKNPEIRDYLVNFFGKDPKKYLYQLGVVLSGNSYDSLDPLMRTYFPIMQDNSKLSVKTYNSIWELCSLSEAYLRRSFDRGDGLVLVNERLLTKKRGYKVALCLESFGTETSTFIRGNWYEPEGEARKVVKEALSKGTRTMMLDEGDWVLMRPMEGNDSDALFERAKRFAKGEDTRSLIEQAKNRAIVIFQKVRTKH